MDVEKPIEFILDMQAQAVVNQAKRDQELARREKFADRSDRFPDRVIGLAAREASAERRRRRGGNGSHGNGNEKET